MAWTDAEKRAIQNLVLRIEILENKIAGLQDCCNNNNTCSCDCKVYPHYVSIGEDYFSISYDEYGNPVETHRTDEELGITHDRFPEPACVSEKGIIFMNDVVLFCHYHEQDGWIIFEAVKRIL